MKNGLFIEHAEGINEHKQDLVIFFHGFPARSTKNEDLQKFVNQQLGYATLLYHYSGLGQSSGKFDFLGCLEFSKKLCEEYSTSYKRVHCVGHSWGGLVATNSLLSLPSSQSGRLILLNPLMQIPAAKIMLDYISESFGNGGLRREDYSDNDIIKMSQQNTQLDQVHTIEVLKDQLNPRKTHFILASDDTLVPFDASLKLCTNLNISPQIVRDDHWFTNSRVAVIRLLESILS